MNIYVLLRSLPLLVLASVGVSGQSRPWGDFAEMNGAPVLAEAGIDRNDQQALIRALHHESPSVRLMSIFGLGKLPSTPAAVDALLGLLDSSDDTTLMYAVGSLVELKTTGWTNRVVPRMGSIKTKRTEVELWGLLAEAGEYSGYPVVKEALSSGTGSLSNALVAFRRFEGMRDSQGKLVDLAEELSIMLPRMPEQMRAPVSFQIDQLRAK
jgi:hypothetical protein